MAIAFTTSEKREGILFQSVVISSMHEYPQFWKLKKLVLYLTEDPKSSDGEQWTEQ